MEAIKKLRAELNLSQQALSDAIDLDQSTFSKYELCRRLMPIPIALRIVKFAKTKNYPLSLDQIYTDHL
jgi:transcriptional regulator with XRE-family HTH domain